MPYKLITKYIASPMVLIGLLLFGLFMGSAWADRFSDSGFKATKTVLEQWAVPGHKLTYYIIVENHSNQTKIVSLTDTLPSLTTYSSHEVITGQDDGFIHDDGVVNWNVKMGYQSGRNVLVIRLEVMLNEDLGEMQMVTNTVEITSPDTAETLSVHVDVPVATPTPQNTSTPTPTSTPTATDTATPTPTLTITTTLTPTATITPSTTSSPTPTATVPPASTLYLPIIQHSVCKGDTYEPNNSPDAAPEIVMNVAIEAWFCTGDPDDYYLLKIDGDEAMKVEIDLYDVHSQSDLDLYLYDEELNLVAFSYQGRFGESEKISTELQPSSYFVRIYPFEVPVEVVRSTYSLIVTESSTQ